MATNITHTQNNLDYDYGHNKRATVKRLRTHIYNHIKQSEISTFMSGISIYQRMCYANCLYLFVATIRRSGMGLVICLSLSLFLFAVVDSDDVHFTNGITGQWRDLCAIIKSNFNFGELIKPQQGFPGCSL